MVENGFRPGPTDVAECAIGSVKTVMHIFCAMTGVTLCRCISITRFDVTRCAIGIEVSSDQRITGLGAVVEFDLTPSGLDMAGPAVLVECPVVIVIVRMAIETKRRRFTMFCAVFMAVLTTGLPMCADQIKIGQLMIKQPGVEADDIRVRACMFGMTRRALFYIGVVIAPVVSGSVPYVTRHILVAGLAQGPLFFT